jgi:hypothetical protein
MDKKLICVLALFLALAVGGAAQADLASWEAAIGIAGPLHWYKFNETAGTDCLDSGSGALKGVYNGVTLAVEGFFGAGTGAQFTRPNGTRVEFAGATDLSAPYTAEYIAKTFLALPALQQGQAMHDGDISGLRLAGYSALSEIGFVLYGVADYRFTPEAGLTLNDLIAPQNEWLHLAFRNNGTLMQVFVNGKLMGSQTNLVPLGRLRIGSRATGTTSAFDGVLDEAVVFDRALTDGDIIRHALASSLFDESVRQAGSPIPADGAILSDTWVNLTWSAGPFAVSQDVYLGDNFEDVTAGTGNTFRVNQPQSLSSFFVGLGMPGDPYPSGLVPGTTYYWRVDEVNSAAPNSPWKGNVWSFRVRPKTAHEPSPSDGAKYQDPGVTLTWTAGIGAKLHYVYLGDNFNDVNSATTGGTAVGTANHTSPTPLAKGKTYYWRVDEFDGAATYKGDVWSLTTLGDLPITDPNLVAWYKFETGEGTRVVDFSGHNNHGTIVPGTAGTVQWAEGLFNLGLDFLGDNQGHVDMPPGIVTTAQGSILMWINTTQGDAANNDEGMLWWASQTSAGDGYGGENEIHINIDDPGNGQLDFFLEQDVAGTSDITINGPDVGGTGWRHVAATWDLTDGVRLYVDGLEVGYAAHNTNIKSFAVMRLGRPVGTGSGNCYYDGLMDDVRLFNHAISAAQISQIIAKGENPLQAGTANPSDGAQVAINLATPLNWSAGEKASQHDVYFGLDKAAVADANASDTAGVYRGRQSATSYIPPEGVQFNGGPYYWRIDEVNTDGTITQGRVWSFSVANYALVEDFEAYNDIPDGQPGSNLVYAVWNDGLANPTAYGGSTIGYPVGVSMETAKVHSGRQAVPLIYDNSTALLSEAELPLAQQNWTEHGVLTLSLWFYGDPANVAGQLYVKINTVKVAYDGDRNNLKAPAWQVWNIDLASVGTNLQSVTSLAIGIEGAGATGTLLLDDIRLYRQADAPAVSGVVEVPRTSVAPLIDGQWDAVWNAVPETRCLITHMINTSSAAPEDANDLSAVFKAAYDDNNFYIFVEVHDSVIDTTFSDHQGDGVEIYFDGDLSRGSTYDGVNDNQIRITVADVAMADTTSTLAIDGTAFKVLRTAVGYNIEASFPLAKLGILPLAPDKMIGFEVQINDNDHSGGRQSMLRWYSDNNNSYQNASLFGVARLVSRVVGN